MDIAFVILHYKTYYDTIECIESIRKRIDTKKYGIIVVDNASNNGSLEILMNSYNSAENIIIVSNVNNVGFAKGLNIGIKKAREYWNPKFIAAINNDTLLISDNLVEVIYKKYKTYEFAVAGPMIITKDGYCNTNPIRDTIRSVQEVEQSIRRYKTINILCDLHLIGLYNFFKKFIKKKCSKRADVSCLIDQTDFKLHGSFWIFSEKYFDVFKELDPSTFLYGEEDILYLHIIKNGLHTIYTPDIRIYHKEDSSTNATISNTRKKTKFVCTNSIKSLEIYSCIYKKYEELDRK